MRFHIETYGCTANIGNSREVEAALSLMGHISVPLDEADAVIVNTCAVTEKTERRIRRRLLQLQGNRLVIAGCLPAALPGSVEGIRCLHRTGILGRPEALEIANLFGSHGSSPHKEVSRPPQELCGIVNISEGCNGACSYCIVRRARGRLISRSMGDVLSAMRGLIGSGIVEVQITSQDCAAYGADVGANLPKLLRRLTRVPGDYMIRIGMMNPNTVLSIIDDLIPAMSSPKIYKFVHLPLQSGSDRILEGMGRGYTRDDFFGIIDRLRSEFDGIFIVTDVITGFPGETDDDFSQTLDLIKSLEPDKVNVTKFSRRPGTRAAALYDMPDRIKKDRSRKATRLWLDIARMRNRRYEGRIMEALVTEPGQGNTAKARLYNYAGIVVAGSPRLGSRLDVRVIGSNPFYLTGSAHTQ
jgi:threonylcarbamoyladenosine tRNA methylthiotransferase CDKAL1